MTKRFIPVLAACLFLMVGTAQAATSLAFPPPDTKGGKPLMQTLSGRATNRSFTAKPLSDKLLGDLLWAAYGVNRPNGKRTIPTAQNRQDLEIYVLRSDGAWLYDAPETQPRTGQLLRPAQLPRRAGLCPRSPGRAGLRHRHPEKQQRAFRGHAYGFRLPERGLVLRLRGAAQRRPRFLRRRRPRFRPRPPQIQAYPDFPKHRMGRIEKSIP